MDQTQWADRGQLLQLESPEGAAQAGCVGVSRLGSAQLSGQLFSVWVQLRGASWVEAKEGKFRLRLGKGYRQKLEAKPGDVIWLPEGTPLRYEGDKAVVFYALHPVDWLQRHGMA